MSDAIERARKILIGDVNRTGMIALAALDLIDAWRNAELFAVFQDGDPKVEEAEREFEETIEESDR